MRKLIHKLLSLFGKRRDKNPVIQDLLDNDHHYCKVCGDLFYSTNPKRLYCSKACKVHFNNAKRSRK
jgi:hypothetical protein